MKLSEILSAIPRRRVHAVDGMAVTADVWQESHEHHRQTLALHYGLSHRPGILAGLEVIANVPADTAVFLKPGIAVDNAGRLIVLNEGQAYEVGGATEGLLYLLLTYGESHPRPADGNVPEGAPLFIHAQFGLEAVNRLPEAGAIELARVHRQSRDSKLTDARNPSQPGPDEIDLRYRRHVGVQPDEAANIAVVSLGGSGTHTRGVHSLARALRSSGQMVWADENVTLGGDLSAYTLVHLVGHGRFALTAEQMNGIYAYWHAGGTLLLDICRREAKAAGEAEAAFGDMLGSLGIKVAPLTAGHPLLVEPALFSGAPPGFDGPVVGDAVRVGDGLVFSAADYGCAWQGEVRAGAAPREAIRTAHEWGGNILAYARLRRTNRAQDTA